MLLLARLNNQIVEVFRGFGRRSPYRFYCQYGRLQMAVEKLVGVMRRLTTIVAIIARCRVYSIHVLTMYSAVTCAQLCQYSSYLPWQCLYRCGDGRRSAIKQLWWTAFNGSSDRILVDAADFRYVPGVAEWLFGEVLLDVRPIPVHQRSSSFRPVCDRAEGRDVVVDGMLWRTTWKSVRYAGELIAPEPLDAVRRHLPL